MASAFFDSTGKSHELSSQTNELFDPHDHTTFGLRPDIYPADGLVHEARKTFNANKDKARETIIGSTEMPKPLHTGIPYYQLVRNRTDALILQGRHGPGLFTTEP